ncbi:MAG: hypothetical protein Q7S56_03755 [Nanoarchaeota archaeon]|nr:hypothetical protein [Nanoarchaeota archaeon]
MEEKIQAAFIIEVIGRPPNHLIETLNDLLDKMGKEKGVKVGSKKINEPILLRDQKEFYTSFAEVEVEVDEVMTLIRLMFQYMPAHVEIISPERIMQTNQDWMEVMNELLRVLHGYDEVARVVQNEKNILESQLRSLLAQKKSSSESVEPIKEEKSEDKKGKSKKKKNG